MLDKGNGLSSVSVASLLSPLSCLLFNIFSQTATTLRAAEEAGFYSKISLLSPSQGRHKSQPECIFLFLTNPGGLWSPHFSPNWRQTTMMRSPHSSRVPSVACHQSGALQPIRAQYLYGRGPMRVVHSGC